MVLVPHRGVNHASVSCPPELTDADELLHPVQVVSSVQDDRRVVARPETSGPAASAIPSKMLCSVNSGTCPEPERGARSASEALDS